VADMMNRALPPRGACVPPRLPPRPTSVHENRAPGALCSSLALATSRSSARSRRHRARRTVRRSHGRAVKLAAAAVPCLRASPLLASSTNTSSWFPRTRTTHPRPRRRRELHRHRAVACCGRRRTWPGHHEPPRAKTSCPMGAREVPGAPPPPHRRRRASSGRKQRTPAPPLLQIPSRTSRDNSTIVKGLSAMSLTQVNSASEDLFAVNRVKL